MRGRELRSFFQRAYADVLPLETRKKTKHGFGLPIPVWLRTDPTLNEMMHDLVLGPRSLQRGYFRRSALERLVEAHRTDASSFYGTYLWNLMVLELWQRQGAARPRAGG
jgi:asparagine synthase (glutamine-hydrolysing)